MDLPSLYDYMIYLKDQEDEREVGGGDIEGENEEIGKKVKKRKSRSGGSSSRQESL